MTGTHGKNFKKRSKKDKKTTPRNVWKLQAVTVQKEPKGEKGGAV